MRQKHLFNRIIFECGFNLKRKAGKLAEKRKALENKHILIKNSLVFYKN